MIYLEENWDGEGAKAVSMKIWANAQKLLKDLPPGFPEPSIMGGIDGSLGIFWSSANLGGENRNECELYIDFCADNRIRYYYRYENHEGLHNSKDIKKEEKIINEADFSIQHLVLMEKIDGVIQHLAVRYSSLMS
jgi:hypothetical protein